MRAFRTRLLGWVGWGLISGGIATVLWFAAAQENESQPEPRPDASRGSAVTRPAETPPTRPPEAGPGTAAGTEVPREGGARRTGRARGWIPDGAVEATATSGLRADPDTDPLCAADVSMIDVGKSVAVSLESELRAATRISDEEESLIGEKLERAIARQKPFSGRWDLAEDRRKYGDYLEALVQHIAKGRSRRGITYRVHVVRRPEMNAAALPGGALMVFTGAIEGASAVQDESEIVAVIGHEIAHVERRHAIAAYQYARALLGDQAEDGMLAMKILTMPIASEYEHEADDLGLELAMAAQYDPSGAVALWRRHAMTEPPARPGILGGIVDGVEDVLRSHPKPSERACRAMRRVRWARDHSPWERVYRGRTNLLTRTPGPVGPY